MVKKDGEKIVTQEKQKPKTSFPKKAKDQFLALREWLEENHDRDVFQIVEDDRKLIYGKVREKALAGNMDALKAIFNKMFPEMRIERQEQTLTARQLVEIYVRLCPPGDQKQIDDKPDGKTPNSSEVTEETE